MSILRRSDREQTRAQSPGHSEPPGRQPGSQPVAPQQSAGSAAHDPRAEKIRQRELASWRELQRLRGLNLGGAVFGWLVAVGLGALLTALLAAAGLAIGLQQGTVANVSGSAATLTFAGAVVLTAVLLLSYYAGGYVAGRLSRFDGAVQGVAVWGLGVLVTAGLAIAGAIAGSNYNVLAQLRLPSIPVQGQSFVSGGVIALVLIAVATLVASVLGGIVGCRYHSRVDRALNVAGRPG